MEVIRADNVGMSFRISNKHTTSMKEWVITKLKKEDRYHEFIALQDVNFSVNKGDIVGIIGSNGSGKSTLLKIISGIYKPTDGRISVAGHIAPLLELGSGFDYELSGEENVFLNGAIMGYSASFLKSQSHNIVDFSELGEFIHQPIKTYSSGMLMRLAFSVATLVEPDILIVDEILAVGDEKFQKKSYAKMQSLMCSGATVLLVSHNLTQVREMCTKVIWLEQGCLRMIGDTDVICNAYMKHFS